MDLEYRGNPRTSFIAFSACSGVSNDTNACPRIRRLLCATTSSTPYGLNRPRNEDFNTEYFSVSVIQSLARRKLHSTVNLYLFVEVLNIEGFAFGLGGLIGFGDNVDAFHDVGGRWLGRYFCHVESKIKDVDSKVGRRKVCICLFRGSTLRFESSPV